MNDVFIGKVYGGEFVIGKYLNGQLMEVYSLIIIPQQDGGFNAAIAPVMMPFSQKAIKSMSEDKFIALEEAPSTIAQKYLELTSGLVVPQKPSGIQIVKS